MNAETLVLAGMSAPASSLPAWEAEWTVFGPITNPGDSGSWPGEIGFSPLPLDGANFIPERASIDGTEYMARTLYSEGGDLDLARALEPRSGLPIAYLMTTVDSPIEGWLPISFGANWGTQWWVNGEAVFDSTGGNAADPQEAQTQQFYAPARRKKNLVVIKVIAGTTNGWMITLRRLPVVAALPEPAPLPPAAPVRRRGTRDYARAGLRLEHRPGAVPAAEANARETALAAHGVEAHWIGIVDHTGSPYADSDVLPAGEHFAAKNAERFRAQIAAIHANGMAAITWFPGVHCRSAAAAHPDWRSVPVGGERPETFIREPDWNLCPNTPFGDALIAFVLESLERYGLDGFWFDGTSRSGRGLGCVCAHCARKFRAETGLEAPSETDWDSDAFCRWVDWRARDYMAFWARLSGNVRRRFPNARIVVNHLHRLRHGFHTGLPLRRYDADLIAGTEAQDSPFVTAFHARLQRAYGLPECEVWMGLHKAKARTDRWPSASWPEYRYHHHALAAMTAGAMPSFGIPFDAEDHADLYNRLSTLINPRRDLVGGQPEAYAAVLLSQQAETFHFSRRPGDVFPDDYWDTVVGWHHLLVQERLLTAIIFDDALKAGELAAFPVVVLPLAVALSDAQLTTLEDYVRGGGLLVTDRVLGSADEWGEPAPHDRAAPLLGEPARPLPEPDADLASDDPGAVLRTIGNGHVLVLAGNVGLRFFRSPAAELAAEIARLLRHHAPPRIDVAGPPGLHVGVFREPGRLLIHLHNFVPWSDAEGFPNPILTTPTTLSGTAIYLDRLHIRQARQVLPESGNLKIVTEGDRQRLELPTFTHGMVVECRS